MLTIPFYYATRLKALDYTDNRQLSSHKYRTGKLTYLEVGENAGDYALIPRLYNHRSYPYVTAA